MDEKNFSEKESADVTKKSAKGTKFYPKFHLAAPFGWINDPNGFCYFNGEYHMFYQYHPYSTEWGPMHWGHATSKDLISWEDKPVALAPDKVYDKDGCFSGSAIEKDGKLYLMYTGHVNVGDHCEQTQCFAVSEDGVTFEKTPGNPVIGVPSLPEVFPFDYRDPKIWQHGKKYYCVIGSKTPENTGQVALYESVNMKNWKFKSIAVRDRTDERTMWECPNLAELDGGDAMIISVTIPQDGFNLYRTDYIAGKFDYAAGIFDDGYRTLIDFGTDFYAPQITTTPDGRVIMIGWLSMWGADMPEREDGWAGMMSIPRELIFDAGKIRTVPAKEMKKLRGEGFTQKNISLGERTELENFCGDVGELLVKVDLKTNPVFALELRADEDERTVLSFDAESNILRLDRENSGVGPKNPSEVRLKKSLKLDLQIFIDKSSIEIFANDGEAVISARIYPKETSQKIFFVPLKNSLEINSTTFYKLKCD